MTATLERPRKKAKASNGNGRHVSPDETGTTTPAGIAANDPNALDADGWTQIRPRLRSLIHMPSGTIAPSDHLLAAQLEEKAIVTPSELDGAIKLVAKYFPGETASSALSADEPPRRGGAENGKSNGKAQRPLTGPEVIEATGPPKREVRDFGGSTVSRVKWGLCDPHPANATWRQDDIDDLAESLKAEQQMLEKPVVRMLTPIRWQILSGHRRIAAALKIGWKEGDAHVVQCDDARAVELVALYNAKRKDLTPIDKAKMIERLCKHPTDGGAGYTREQAARVYDLESGAAASNLVRLLELPEVWQERVASGELPWTFARELLPYAKAPKLMEAFDADWEQAHRAKASDYARENWENRRELQEHIWCIVERNTRPMDGKMTQDYDHGQVGAWGVHEPRLFEVTDELREQLGVVTIPHRDFVAGGKVRDIEVATDAKLFDKLNIPLIKAKLAKKFKGKAAKAGADSKPEKRELTPAQQKANAKKQADQLQKRIELWRHRWLAGLVAERVAGTPQLREWLVVWMLAHRVLGYMDHRPIKMPSFEKLAELGHEELIDAGTDYVCQVLTIDAEREFHGISDKQLDALAALAGIDLTAAWAELQRDAGKLVSKENQQRARFEAFFELHQTAQLDSLGNELGVHLEHVKGKEQKIHLLTTCSRTLKLPKSIKPVAGVKAGKQKAAKGTK